MGAEGLARLRAVSFSETHLGGRDGQIKVLPLVEAYIREEYTQLANP